MSDFDKEAEREKLREKYASERDDREATQRMSELLLKGATMTNQHCGTCGDPIFRHDGQTFCPSCASDDTDRARSDATSDPGQGEAAERSASVDATPARSDDATTDEPARSDGASADTTRATADTPRTGAGTPRTDADTPRTDAGTPRTDAGTPRTDADTDRPNAASVEDAQSSARSRRDANESRQGDPARSTPTPGDRRTSDVTDHQNAGVDPVADRRTRGEDPVAVDADAIAAVEATVERFAAEAARTDDPARARECLAVVRDATETLRALRTD